LKPDKTTTFQEISVLLLSTQRKKPHFSRFRGKTGLSECRILRRSLF